MIKIRKEGTKIEINKDINVVKIDLKSDMLKCKYKMNAKLTHL